MPFKHVLFPKKYSDNYLANYIQTGIDTLQNLLSGKEWGRIPSSLTLKEEDLINRYGKIPEKQSDPREVIQSIISSFFPGAIQWRSKRSMLNIGSAVNTVSVALQAISLDLNINLVNDDTAGNAMLAETAVANILCNLAGLNLEEAHGFFTFGGTGTILYAVKCGLRKALPDSGREGISQGVCVFTTEDAHFSHAVVVDWLGIGIRNVFKMKASQDRKTNILDAELKLRTAIEQGMYIAAIIINGGTTYDHTIDDIYSFVKMRNKLVSEYRLSYIPHIHVDSVIGWSWLCFKDYDFESNHLGFSKCVLDKLNLQYSLIKNIRFADSWGVDFHKGIGSCPVDCSMIIMNNKKDFLSLSKKVALGEDLHQVSGAMSLRSPVEYTLETSRSAGKSFAALGALQAIGKTGFQFFLANLVEKTTLIRELLSCEDDIKIVNQSDLGFVVMVRIYPPEKVTTREMIEEFTSLDTKVREFINIINDYNEQFFKWDKNRMLKSEEINYSFTRKYLEVPSGSYIAALKIYPVSPYLDYEVSRGLVETILHQKDSFDQNIWCKY